MLTRGRAAVACGALGSYDRQLVERMAATSAAAPEVVHADGSSILALDREPIRWRGARQHGLAWAVSDAWRDPRPGDWTAVARAGGTGLAFEGRQRFLHTSVSGLAPLYWLELDDATYFCSQLDPLVRACPRPFSVDWDAWAATIAMRHPLGDRTPFAEVRRLGQFTTLRRRRRRSRVSAHRWPWVEAEAGGGLEVAADGCVASLRDSLAVVREPLPCPLSGGRDSRMLFATLALDGRVARALTASDDEGETIEEDLAAGVAELHGVPQERLAGTAAQYAADWEERARRVEYQFVDHPWLMPLAHRLEGDPAYLPDGFGIDVFGQSGRHFSPPEALDNSDPRAASRALFAALRAYGRGDLGLAPDLRGALRARAQDAFFAAVRPFEGHSSQNVLSLYETRARRGVGNYPAGLFGRGGQVLAPGVADAFVRASLQAGQREKAGGRLYTAIYARLSPATGRLPSTSDTSRTGPRLPRRWRSPEALAMHRDLLAAGPLTPFLSADLRAWLAHPDGHELSIDLRVGLEAIALMHAWWRRYRDHLRPLDATDLLASARRPPRRRGDAGSRRGGAATARSAAS